MLEFCNGLFTAKRDKHCWVLKEKYLGKEKDGVRKEKFKETYHANLSQICEEVIDRRAGECDDAAVIIGLLKRAGMMLTSIAAAHLPE